MTSGFPGVPALMTEHRPPSRLSARFCAAFFAALAAVLFSVVPLVSGRDYAEEQTHVLKGVVTAFREDSVSVSETEDDEKEVRRETAFALTPVIEYAGIERWDDLKLGNHVIVTYRDKRLIHEGKDEKGGSFQEASVIGRDIIRLEVTDKDTGKKLLKAGY
ncbi:MAG TPA: hypothetical protein VL688_10860 [Verrucomicrobiae bacterium]|jgi:hypothetical protein|nr:hypothetical protein [Verrucomicrobiae bacterium]